jgi:hypothetical protein
MNRIISGLVAVVHVTGGNTCGLFPNGLAVLE